jgi:hypothetical protein
MRRRIRKLWHWCLGISMITWLRVAGGLTLVALALMVWSLLDPTLVPIIIGMSLAQVFGTIAFAIYGTVVFVDLTRKRRAKRASLQEIKTS